MQNIYVLRIILFNVKIVKKVKKHGYKEIKH